MTTVNEIWNFQFALLPVLLAYAIFEIPTLARRYSGVAYVPIYFLFFPLGHADELYAQYFNEDYFYGIGQCQTRAEKNKVRKRLVALSIVSIAFAAVVSPALAAMFSAIFLTHDQFVQFFWFLLVVKTFMVAKALRNTRGILFVHTSGSFPMIAAIYVVYLAIVCRVVVVAHDWAVREITAAGIAGMLLSVIDLLIFDLGIYFIAAGAIGAVVSYWLTDPDNIPEPIQYDAVAVETVVFEARDEQ